ncbi:MAG: NusG domain II-containing protein [Spirochaetaceae bacterium]|nr:NusG domain II-containing protein [Spirochaetaceae bacterium]
MKLKGGSLGYRLKIGDLIAIIVFIGVFAYSLDLSTNTSNDRPFARIESTEGEYLYPLETDVEFTVKGPQGLCRIKISDEILRVIDSDCLDKICQSLTPLMQIGDWTACLPNRVMITLIGNPSETPSGYGELDSLSY